MPIFGNQNPSNQGMVVTRIRAGIFACPEAGIAQSITAYIECGGVGVANFKAALYTYPERTLVAITEELLNIAQGVQWRTFNFPGSKPALTNRQYILAIWADTSSSDVYFNDGVVGAVSGYTIPSQVYPDFPSYLNGSYIERADRITCIYCTYERMGKNLTIQSSPNSVPVNVDNILIGNTPQIVALQEGTHIVEVPNVV